MSGLKWLAPAALLAVIAPIGPAVVAAADPATPTVIATMDLAAPFATRSPWRFTATQGPSIPDPVGATGDTAPGEVTLCLRSGDSAPCDPQLQSALRAATPGDLFFEPHYLNSNAVVHEASGLPVLLVQTASLHSGDGDQLVLTQALAYQRSADRFVRVYDHSTGTNNNQEVRFLAAGPLKGDIVSVEPTANAPFGFWVTVNAPASAYAPYKQVLRYRSATRYGDGNPLAVIDSEMANIESRLGLWHAGAPLPLPAGACPTPHLVKMELWCK